MRAPVRAAVLALSLAAAAPGCTFRRSARPPRDHTAYREHMPCSILVLPPLNETSLPGVSHAWLTTVTRSLTGRGYYVLPVAVTERFLIENGLISPGEMHGVAAETYGAILGADAVLYPTLREWGTRFPRVVARVAVSARLVDTRTGTLLWEGTATVQERDIVRFRDRLLNFKALVIHAVPWVLSSDPADDSRAAARSANHRLFWLEGQGLPPGPRWRDPAGAAAAAAAAAAEPEPEPEGK